MISCHLKNSLKRTFLAASFIFSLLGSAILFDLLLSYLLFWKVGILLLILHVVALHFIEKDAVTLVSLIVKVKNEMASLNSIHAR